MNQCGTKEDREHSFIERLNKQYPTIKYIGGYEDSDKEVTLQCKICGFIFTRTAQCIRGGRNLTCFNCVEIESKKKKLLLQQKKRVQEIKLERQKKIAKIYKYLKANTILIRQCVVCKKEYLEITTSRYCAKCRRKIRHRHSGKSLVKLFKRDNGVCYICGGLCNWNDKIEDKNTIVVGKTYPSIDHVIPLVEGGTDDWNNLKLAHFECNRVKGGVS